MAGDQGGEGRKEGAGAPETEDAKEEEGERGGDGGIRDERREEEGEERRAGKVWAMMTSPSM
jgi:hypothetical protein